jgi:hypothetical protein
MYYIYELFNPEQCGKHGFWDEGPVKKVNLLS